MKERIMRTVHALLQRSGQTVPAKHLSSGDRSLQIYDVDHWPETFNSLLIHDFPSIVISVDSSVASLSGFVITIHWIPSIDRSGCIHFFIHILFLCATVLYVANKCLVLFHGISVKSVQEIKDTYVGNSTVGDVGSILTDELRAVMAQGGF